MTGLRRRLIKQAIRPVEGGSNRLVPCPATPFESRAARVEQAHPIPITHGDRHVDDGEQNGAHDVLLPVLRQDLHTQSSASFDDIDAATAELRQYNRRKSVSLQARCYRH